MTKEEIVAYKKDLSYANLRYANLSSADLSYANLSFAKVRSADLSSADLSYANLRSADLSSANLRSANLSYANPSFANFRSVNLSYANLSFANLSYANLSSANLRSADLRSADLSGTIGLLDASEWLKQFKTDRFGIYVYKGLGNTTYPIPDHWRGEKGNILHETPNPDRCTECGSGVNFASEEWVRKTYPGSEIWRCLIPWEYVAGIVVPYNTDGKARCSHLQLVNIVKRGTHGRD